MFLFDSFHNKEDNFYYKKSLEKILSNYSFTKDNLIKMTLILIKLEAKIPVIIMGKSGYGNSLLIQKLFDFVSYGNFNNLKVLDFYPGIKFEEIINFFNLIILEVISYISLPKLLLFWIFIELNTISLLLMLLKFGSKFSEKVLFCLLLIL